MYFSYTLVYNIYPMGLFEPHLQASADLDTFSSNLETRIAEALGAFNPESLPKFDTYGLTPLGYAVSEELGRVVAESPEPYLIYGEKVRAAVPKWVARGNSIVQGGFIEDDTPPEKLFGTPRDKMSATDYSASLIAANCLQNGASTVADANFLARSVLGIKAVAEAEPQGKIAALRGARLLVRRFSMLNDTNPDAPGRKMFNRNVSVENRQVDNIYPGNMEFNETPSTVRFTKEIRKVISMASGEGCPALRKDVHFRGELVPMIESFWTGAVDVIGARLDQPSP
jgi:hypothetical protein